MRVTKQILAVLLATALGTSGVFAAPPKPSNNPKSWNSIAGEKGKLKGELGKLKGKKGKPKGKLKGELGKLKGEKGKPKGKLKGERARAAKTKTPGEGKRKERQRRPLSCSPLRGWEGRLSFPRAFAASRGTSCVRRGRAARSGGETQLWPKQSRHLAKR